MSEQNTQDILRGGFELFAQRGYANTNISDIAAAMGIPPEKMAEYFVSKEEFTKEMVNFGVTIPKNKREQQKEKRRQDILLAGLDLFIRRGYTATRISDIAAAVGMSTGLMFHYFESKEKLYEELVQLGQYGPNSMMEINQSDPLQFFQTAAEMILAVLKASPAVAKVFVLMGQAQHNEAAPDSVKEMVAQIENIEKTIHIIELGQQSGVIREGDPRALSIAFWGAIQGIAEEFAVMETPPQVEAEWLVDIVRKNETKKSGE